MNNKENIDTYQNYLKKYNLYAQTMILTITLNPSIDISVMVPALIPSEKLRCESYEKEVGGGGINVATGLHRLGLPTDALFFSGGLNGHFIESRLKGEGLVIHPIPIQPETRENITVTDQASLTEYRLVNKGHEIKPADEKLLLKTLNQLKIQPDFLVLSGSHPPGLSDQFVKKIANWAAIHHCKLIVDMPAEPLSEAFKFRPFLIKPNLKEISQIAGKSSLTVKEAIQTAKEWIAKEYTEIVVISMGAQGAIICDANEEHAIKPPKVKTLSTVGAGDSMVAGLLFKMYERADLKDILRMGVACGTAATVSRGTKLFERELAFKLYDQIKEAS